MATTPTANATAAQASPTAAQLSGTLTVYSGRTETLVAPALEEFTKSTGIQIQARYGDTAELAAAILEEGGNSPADVYFAQDAGALGALAAQDRLTKLPDELLNRVEERFRSPAGEWVGVSGRARVVCYNTEALQESDLPDSVLGFTDAKWKDKIGWAPTNASFQSFVTALRVTEGEDVARQWLEGIIANNPKKYNNNMAIVVATGAGEIEVGFVNHYYLYNARKDRGESFPVANYYPRDGGAGALINVAGVGILGSSKQQELAQRLVDYLLSKPAQQYFADQTFEYPLIADVSPHPDLRPLDQIKTPPIDLSSLSDLEATLTLLRDVGAL